MATASRAPSSACFLGSRDTCTENMAKFWAEYKKAKEADPSTSLSLFRATYYKEAAKPEKKKPTEAAKPEKKKPEKTDKTTKKTQTKAEKGKKKKK